MKGTNKNKSFSLWNCKRQCAKYDRLMLRELKKGDGKRDEALIYEYIELRNLYAKAADALANDRAALADFKRQRTVFSFCAVFSVLILILGISGIAQASGVRVWTAAIEGDIRYLNPSFNNGKNIISPSPEITTSVPHPTIDPTTMYNGIPGGREAAYNGNFFPKYFRKEENLHLAEVLNAVEDGNAVYIGKYEGTMVECTIKVTENGKMPPLSSDTTDTIEYCGETGNFYTIGKKTYLYHLKDGMLYEFIFPYELMQLSALPLQTFMSVDISENVIVYGD